MIRISCSQFAPTYREIDANLEYIAKTVRATDADICIFPELALTGYAFKTVEEIAPLAQTTRGAVISQLSSLAREHSKAIITGHLEELDGRYYNSAIALDLNGTLVGHYRKAHLFYYETQIFSPGDLGFPVFDLRTRNGIVKTGMLVCYDWRFPEAARALAVQGAELIAIPSNIVTTTGMLHTTLQTRAFENKVVLAFADRIGTEQLGDESLLFRGESAIINYNGEILCKASADQQEVIVAEVDLTTTRHKRINTFNDIMGDRKHYNL